MSFPQNLCLFIIFLIAGLIGIIGVLFTLHLNIDENLLQSKNTFQAATDIAKLDFYARKIAHINFESVTNINIIMRFQVNTVPPGYETLFRKSVSAEHQLFPKILGTERYFLFSVRRMNYAIDGLLLSLKNIVSSEVFKKKNTELLDLVLDNRIDIRNWYIKRTMPLYKLSLMQFSLVASDKLRHGASFIEKAEPYISGKTFPFKMPRGLLLQYQKPLLEMFTLLLSIFTGVLKKYEEVFLLSLQDTLYNVPAHFQMLFWILSSLSLILSLVFTVFSIVFARRIQASFKRIIMVYTHMRPREISFQLAVFKKSIRRIESSFLSEKKLLLEYSRIGQTRGTLPWHLNSRFVSTAEAVAKSKISITQRGNMSFFWAVVILSGIFFVFVVANVIILASFEMSLQSNLKVQRYYFDSYQAYIPVSNRYFAFVLDLFYGSFVLFDGKLPRDYRHDDGGRNFGDYSAVEKVQAHLPSKDVQALKELLYGDICKYLSGPSIFEKAQQHACETYAPAKKGLANILLHEAHVLQEKQKAVRATKAYKVFLQKSRIKFVPSPEFLYFYEEEVIKLRLMHDSAISVFMENLFEIMDRYLLSVYERTLRSKNALQAFSSSFLYFLIYFFFKVTLHYYKKNKNLSDETFRIILPEIVEDNPFIWEKYRRYLKGKN